MLYAVFCRGLCLCCEICVYLQGESGGCPRWYYRFNKWIMIFFYSGCGNSRHVAEKVAEATGDQLVYIPQAAREGKTHYAVQPDERVGFVFPIYSWRPPQLVLDFVSGLRLEGKPSYVYMFVTYGDDAGLADQVLGKALEAAGLQLDAAFGVTMPNTYVNMSFMDVDKPDVVQRKLKEAESRVGEVSGWIAARKRMTDLNRGGAPRLKTFVVGVGFNKWVSDEKYRATDACVSCGRCAEVCPLQNITIEDGRPRWNGHCTHCEACYHYCPQNAVQFGRVTRGKGQYHFDEKNG